MSETTEGEEFIAECEYTCGYSYGPAEHSDVWRSAVAHESECNFGGPVIRNVKTPAPFWVNDPFLDRNIGYTPPHFGAKGARA